MSNEKVAVIVYARDPEGELRFLIRRNAPFGEFKYRTAVHGWYIVTGNVEASEDAEIAAKREVKEEFGISEIVSVTDPKIYKVAKTRSSEEKTSQLFLIEVRFTTDVQLNNESIGYQWVKFSEFVELVDLSDYLLAQDLAGFLNP